MRDFVNSRVGRRRPADQGARSTSTPTPSSCCGPTATRSPTCRADMTTDDQATRSRRSAATMAAPTASRPSRRPTSTSPTARSTTGCGASTRHLRLHVRAVPAHVEPRLLPARRGRSPRDVAQPRGGPAAARGRRLHVPRDRQAGAVLRPAGPGHAVLGHVRGRARLDDQRGRHRHRDGRAVRARRPGRDDLERREAARHDGERRQRPRDRPARRRVGGRRTTSTAARRRSARRRSR